MWAVLPTRKTTLAGRMASRARQQAHLEELESSHTASHDHRGGEGR
eukprot:COSAG01_NODE_31695_length_592_cov_2994.935091_2_plen_45_part_01